MDIWVSCLDESQTIPTLSLPLSIAEARSLVELHYTTETAPDIAKETRVIYDALIDKVSQLVSKLGDEVFIKLSCRSAKDVAAVR